MAAPHESLHSYPLEEVSSAATYTARCLANLKPHLPTSLPLYRRLQSGRFLAASYIITNINCEDLIDSDAGDKATTGPWLIAFVDRSCRPETELWMFGSWETSPSEDDDTNAWQAIDRLLLDLILLLKGLGLPTSIHQDVLDAQAAEESNGDRDSGGYSRADYGSHATNPNIMLWGAVHERSFAVIQRLGLLSQAHMSGFAPNFSFVFDIDALSEPKPLPDGFRWGELSREHFGLVRSRTMIPRQERTMALLPSLAIYQDGSTVPIAWAFVGLDGSLTTLHVEPEWRGRGFAKALTTKLFREMMVSFHGKGMPKVAHGYVIVGNKQSEGMCRSLGGKSDWECYWLRVDLSKAS